jgi:hypothetical protein
MARSSTAKTAEGDPQARPMPIPRVSAKASRGKPSPGPKRDGTQQTIDEVNAKVAREVARRRRITRSFPASPFEEPLEFTKQIFDFGSGEPVRRLSLFDHLGRAPESGASRQLIVNASRYGLVKGSYSSDLLELTPDASRAVDPQIPPRDQARARIKLAVEEIEVFQKLHERFTGRALPAKAALIDAAMNSSPQRKPQRRQWIPSSLTFALSGCWLHCLAQNASSRRTTPLISFRQVALRQFLRLQ